MIEITVACEGRTEEAFLEKVLYRPLLERSVLIRPRLITTSRGHVGGALTRQRVLRALRAMLRERENVYVTTFFDLYALPSDFPGRVEHVSHPDPLARATAIEAEFHKTVVQKVRCRPDRFFPHIQPYEFEALLFSDVERIAGIMPEWINFLEPLWKARSGAQSPEHINEGPNTHPSARMKALPGYNKVVHGIAIARQTGLDRIRSECRHFGAWLNRIENLHPIQNKG